MLKVLSIVLGGGKGTRLFPLTKERSKPAVPFGGKFRIVDIPISNCINAGFKKIYILTQFNSASLHLHISKSYSFDNFSGGCVEILAAEQTPVHSGWYEGTADAVRKNLIHFRPQKPTHYLIVS
ncbi:MAG: sugar phosphate nucleotidyltransferase, partial [Spirochaetales bacterium]